MASLVLSDLLVSLFSMPFAVSILFHNRSMPTAPDPTFNKYLQVCVSCHTILFSSVSHSPTVLRSCNVMRDFINIQKELDDTLGYFNQIKNSSSWQSLQKSCGLTNYLTIFTYSYIYLQLCLFLASLKQVI